MDIQVQEAQSTQATPSQRLVQDHYNQDVRRKCPEKVIYHIQGNPHRIISRFLWRSELALCIRWPKYGSFSFSISSSNEYSGLISFRTDWLDHLAVHGTLKSLIQHHSSKASILPCSAFFIVQLSHRYMTTGKTRALTRWTFVGTCLAFGKKTHCVIPVDM